MTRICKHAAPHEPAGDIELSTDRDGWGGYRYIMELGVCRPSVCAEPGRRHATGRNLPGDC
ncbi:MAG: hypothetical protein AAF317_16125 [Pseudomonadota bacterium]